MSQEKPPDQRTIHTDGGTYIEGSVDTGGGDVVGRDQYKITQQAPLPTYDPLPLPDPATLPEPGTLPPGSRLPFDRNALFTGRREPLLALARTLLHAAQPSALPQAQAIAGLGGVGKTQLAVEFAYRYGRFLHGVHWLNARDPVALEAKVATCGAAMALPRWPETQPEQVAYTLRTWQEGGPRLVVPQLTDRVAGRLFSAELSHALQPLPPLERARHQAKIERLASRKRPEDRLLLPRKIKSNGNNYRNRGKRYEKALRVFLDTAKDIKTAIHSFDDMRMRGEL